MRQIKNLLKRIMPVSYTCFFREMQKQNELQEQLLLEIQKQEKSQEQLLSEMQAIKSSQLELFPNWLNALKTDLNVEHELMKIQLSQQCTDISGLLVQSSSIRNQQTESILERIAILEAQLNTLIEQRDLLAQVDKKIDKLDDLSNVKLLTETVKRNVDEVIFAEIFNNMIKTSTWLKDTAFMPGRWAVGYQYLYAMYRILDEFKPQRILEMGLGQSTKLISQYVVSQENSRHIVIENSLEWINFYQHTYEIPTTTQIKFLPVTMQEFEDTNVRVYEGFKEYLSGMKFDCISIDAPWGGDMKKYDRIDILSLLPDCLEDSFVILVDDYNRNQEKNMVIKLEKILTEKRVEYKKGLYSGSKDVLVIASIDNKFLCSM